MSLIDIRQLTKTYISGDVETPVLRGVSFSIEPGEFVAIMGPSGSGKSTLLHILGLLDTQTTGTYLFMGQENTAFSKEEIARVRNKKLGFVFQAFNLLARTSVLQNVQLPLLYSDVPEREWEARAKKAIDIVGMTHRLLHEPSQLSGGEKQRVAIARALVTEPDVIFADEPTGNLDSKSSEMIMESIKMLHEKEHHTVVLITHETYTAEFANRIIRLRDGSIESDAPVVRNGARPAFIK